MREKRTTELFDAYPPAFEVYVHWVYTQIIDTDCMPALPENKDKGFTSSLNIVKLWVLGNFLNDEPFMNSAIDYMLKKSDSDGRRFNLRTLQYAWENTPAGCTMQRVMMDMMAVRVELEHFEKDRDEYPNDFLVEFARRYLSKKRIPCPTLANRCDYHVHEDSEMRCIKVEK